MGKWNEKKVLLIEDEVKLARFVELELKYEGYDVTTCHDGRVGMEMITNQEFDMILLDLMLPGLTVLKSAAGYGSFRRYQSLC